MEHRIVELPAFVMAGYAKHFTPETMSEIPQLWESHSQRLAELAPTDNRICYGLCYDNKDQEDDGGPSFGYMIGVTVTGTTTLPEETSKFEIPASKYVVWTFNDHIKNFGQFVGKVWSDHMPTAGFTRIEGGFDFERYDERWKPETGPVDYYVAVELLQTLTPAD